MPQFVPIPATATSGIDWLINHMRVRINDQKYLHNVVIDENAGTSNGLSGELYETKNMPLINGFDHILRVDRWVYTEVTNTGDAAGSRSYIFNVDSGSFWIPPGAIAPTSGDKVRLSYGWNQLQPYKFQDIELKYFLQESVTQVQQGYYDFNYTISGIGDTFTISPEPAHDEIASFLFAMFSIYLIKKRFEEEAYDNRLVVRDASLSIDLTRGLGELGRSSKDLLAEFKAVIKTLKFDGQSAAFARIDTYSTKPPAYRSGPWSEEWASRYQKDDRIF